jgi:hypothetical protein
MGGPVMMGATTGGMDGFSVRPAMCVAAMGAIIHGGVPAIILIGYIPYRGIVFNP